MLTKCFLKDPLTVCILETLTSEMPAGETGVILVQIIQPVSIFGAFNPDKPILTGSPPTL